MIDNKELKDYFVETTQKKKLELRKTKILVEEALECSEMARNSDKELINDICIKLTGKSIPKEILDIVPCFESITRCKRKFQADGLFCSDKQIADRKESYEEETKEWTRE